MRLQELVESLENCTYGKYYCSTDKVWKCRKGPKQDRVSEEVDPDDQYWPGRQYPKLKPQPQQYKGKLVARHYGGYNGTTMPPDIRKLVDKHVKTASNGTKYINQYDDAWYARVFKDPGLTWDRFLKQLTPYFSITRTQVV